MELVHPRSGRLLTGPEQLGQGRVHDQILRFDEKGLNIVHVVPRIIGTYMNTPTPTDILAQIARIPLMERGKLCTYRLRDRPADAGPYYKLQSWEQGQNHTRHVRPEQVPLLEEALAGYAQFRELTEQYAQLVIEQTRQQLAGVGVKKKPGPRLNSSWRRRKRSGN